MTTINKAAYQKLIAQDIEWLYKQDQSPERDHTVAVLKDSVRFYYPDAQVRCAHCGTVNNAMADAARVSCQGCATTLVCFVPMPEFKTPANTLKPHKS